MLSWWFFFLNFIIVNLNYNLLNFLLPQWKFVSVLVLHSECRYLSKSHSKTNQAMHFNGRLLGDGHALASKQMRQTWEQNARLFGQCSDMYARMRAVHCVYRRSVHDHVRKTTLKGMWYLRKVASSYEQFDPVSTFLCPKYIKFCFQDLENCREDTNEHR